MHQKAKMKNIVEFILNIYDLCSEEIIHFGLLELSTNLVMIHKYFTKH